MTIRIIDILHDTTVDGPGFRTSIYAAGCKHACVGCHNPQSWPMDAGRDYTLDEVMEEIKSDNFANVTFTGGDPFYQQEAFTELAKRIRKETNKTIWAYTGFLFEELLDSPLLPLLDAIVDGPFVLAERDTELLFKGSKNQRIVDVKASLESGKTVIWTR
ncbi:MAG: anaerobic ribonucleoside-triphosphate reductase activating protein [Bacteroidales bacterium]|nr:anaerobic ribonucleoside-triphosphate reductase activating protein [Bacteroidales bacterium]